MRRALHVILSLSVLLLLASWPGFADPPIVTNVDPPQGWVDEDTHITLIGKTFNPENRMMFLPGGPAEVWSSGALSPHMKTISGNYVYTTSYQNCGCCRYFEVWNISDPREPFRVGSISGEFYGFRVAVSGDHAYTGYDDLYVIDITEPSDPRITSQIPLHFRDVAAAGDFAYLADGAGLQIVDVSNPASPLLRGRIDTLDFAHRIAISGTHAYVGTSKHVSGVAVSSTLEIIDVMDPDAPAMVGQYDTPRWITDLSVLAKKVYITASDYGLLVLDASNPATPQLVSAYETPHRDHYIADNRVYINAGRRLHVLDLMDSSAPPVIATMPEPGREMVVSQGFGLFSMRNYLYSYWKLSVYDLHYLVSPDFEVGVIDTPGNATDVAVAGGLAYIADGERGLQIFDVSDPGEPTAVGSYETLASASSVAVSDRYAYVVESGEEGGLSIIDVSNPAKPAAVAFYERPWLDEVAVVGNRAYLADLGFVGINTRPWIEILDISAPANPAYLGSISRVGGYSDHASAFAVTGNTVLLAGSFSRWHELLLFDVEDPTRPRVMKHYRSSRNGVLFGRDVSVSDERAYLTLFGYGSDQGLDIIDIGDPAAPSRIGSYPSSFGGQVLAAGDFAYLFWGSPESTINVLDVSEPDRPFRTQTIRTRRGSLARDGETGLLHIAGGDASIVKPNPPIGSPRWISETELEVTAPIGLAPGPYHVRVFSEESDASVLWNGFRACSRRKLSCALEPLLPAVASTDPRAWRAALSDPPRWRMELAGDEALFSGHGRHEAAIALPEFPENLETMFLFSDELGRTTIDLYLAPEIDAGVVVLTGPDEDDVRALWDAMHTDLACPLPRRDEATYGDIKLAVFPKERVRLPKDNPLGRSSGGIASWTGPLTRYRYELIDGQLDAAFAFGPGADLVMQATGWDEYRCEYVEEESFTGMLRERCAELTASDPRLASHCAF